MPAVIAGPATDPGWAFSGVTRVEVSVFDGTFYWNGAGFGSGAELRFAASGSVLGLAGFSTFTACVFSLFAPSPAARTASTSSVTRTLNGAASSALGANPRSPSIMRLAIFMLSVARFDRKKWRRASTARSMDATVDPTSIVAGELTGPEARSRVCGRGDFFKLFERPVLSALAVCLGLTAEVSRFVAKRRRGRRGHLDRAVGVERAKGRGDEADTKRA